MAEKTDFNISPYYDDYDEDKNYYKVLYKAGRPIQARELTQTQSILQSQMERMGGHFFKEGSLVQGAQTDINTDMWFCKVKSANPSALGAANVNDYIADFKGLFLRGQRSGIVAKIFQTDVETTNDPATLYLRFITQGTDATNTYAWFANEIVEQVTLDSDGAPTVVAGNNNKFEVVTQTPTVVPIGRCAVASITEGVIFTRGYFVKVNAETIILEKYSPRATFKVGLKITESNVTSADDTTLNDNSQGTSNENASGADRFRIRMSLSKQLINTAEDLNFIELGRISNGVIQVTKQISEYGEFENTLARRTFDANGDFIVKQFTTSLREHLNTGVNRGLYTRRRGGNKNKFVLEISTGKAYVRGYEIQKTSTTQLNFSKARSSVTLDDASSSVRLGNNLKVTNCFSLPDFGSEATSTAPFGVVRLKSAVSGGGDVIGYARVRDITVYDGTDTSGIYDQTSVFNLSLFDVKMHTKLTGTTSGATFQNGDKVIGATSGATGIVADNYTSGSSAVFLHDVVGTFEVGEVVNSRISAATLTPTAVRAYNIDRVRSVTSDSASGATDFTGDTVVDSNFILSGTITCTNADATVTGFNTKFISQLKEGDIFISPDGTSNIVSSVTNDEELELTSTFSGSTVSGNGIRRRCKLEEQNKTAAIYAWPRDWVSSSTVTTNTVRKQKVFTISGGQLVIESGSANSELGSASDRDAFSIAVLTSGAVLQAGDIIDLTDPTWGKSYATGAGGTGQSLTVSGFDSGDNSVQLLVSYTVAYSSQSRRSKTLRAARCISVESSNASGVFYGTAYDHRDISLGVSDAFKVRGVYEGVGGAPTTPSAAITDPSGTFNTFESIIGQTSEASAVLIKYAGGARSYWYYTNEFTFVEGETVVGQSSNSIGTMSAVDQGSLNITSRYFFDNGQRDGYYDLAKLTLKPGESVPTNPLLIVFDYFTSSGGDYYDVGSYSGIDYRDIPVYSANKVDLGGLEPDGTYELSDAVDCRPSVGQIFGTSSLSTTSPDPASPFNISDNSGVGARFAPFSYDDGRSFLSARPNITTTGASAINTPSNSSNFNSDISFYVSRIDKVFLHKSGAFQVSKGVPNVTPSKPKAIDDSIELFQLYIPAYTKSLSDIQIRSKNHRRFTMSDIGKISNRLSNLERVTALSMLEKDAQTKQILDGDGFDRFKSGFLVDNFRGHKIGDVNHPDYGCSIDTSKGMLRPQAYTQFIDMYMSNQSSQGFARNNNIVTLPYNTIRYIDQDKSSRLTNVNPYSVYAFVGNMKITPAFDMWSETNNTEVKIDQEGNYAALKAKMANGIGTVWNSWQTTWAGEPESVSTESVALVPGSWNGDPSQGGEWKAGTEVSREITETTENQTRQGITTSLVEDIVETRNDRVVSLTIVPHMRAKTIKFDCTNLKPNTNHFLTFDNISVDRYVRPYNTLYSQDGGRSVTSGIKSDGNGRVVGYFSIPNNNIQRFVTGEKTLKISSSFYNQKNPDSFAVGYYVANGQIMSTETQIISTRNAQIITENSSQSRDFVRRGESVTSSPYDTDAPYVDAPSDTFDPVVTDPPPEYRDPVVVTPEVVITTPAGPVTEPAVVQAEVPAPTPVPDPVVFSQPEPVDIPIVAPGPEPTSPPITIDEDIDVSSEFVVPIVVPAVEYIVNTDPNFSGTIPIIAYDPSAFIDFDVSYEGSTGIVQAVSFPSYVAPETVTAPVVEPVVEPVRYEQTFGQGRVFSNEDFWMGGGVNNDVVGRYAPTGNRNGPTCWMDPLAQSFIVDLDGGMMVTEVDFYFGTKDDFMPVTVQIRNMVNGYPGQHILPMSTSVLNASDITTSLDASVATTFKFDAPVYLEEGKEYCVVMLSNSDSYEVWTSRMGEIDISTGIQISGQPYAGSLFKSQNASTWTAEQTDDLKFALKIAQFKLSESATIKFENNPVPPKLLNYNPITTFNGSDKIKVSSYSHGLYDTSSKTTISGISGDKTGSCVEINTVALTGVPADATYSNQVVTYATGSGGSGMLIDITVSSSLISEIRIVDPGYGYSVTDNLQVQNFDNLADVTFNVAAVAETIAGWPIAALNTSFVGITDITIDSFTVTPDISAYQGNNKLASSWTGLYTTDGGGYGTYMSHNIYFDTLHTMISNVQPKTCQIFSVMNPTAMASPEGYNTGISYTKRSENSYIPFNDNAFFSAPNIIASEDNEVQNMSSNKSLDFRIRMYSRNQNVSPILDLDSVGCICTMNRITNINSAADVPTGTTYVSSTEPEGDNNAFVYVTRKVSLKTPATSIKVYADQFRPVNTNIKLMYKIIRNDEDTPLDDLGFEYFNSDGSADITIETDSRNFKEYEYSADELPEFGAFIIKIVGTGINTSSVPMISALRVMALA